MGSPTLQAKRDLHYRRCTTSKACRYCNYYRVVILLDASVPFRPRPSGKTARCELFGLKPGRAYRISPNGICDRYDNSEYLARLGTNWSSE